jgi:hypothetical protein
MSLSPARAKEAGMNSLVGRGIYYIGDPNKLA